MAFNIYIRILTYKFTDNGSKIIFRQDKSQHKTF